MWPFQRHNVTCFALFWFKDNDIDIGENQTFCFTRHVWGINPSPYIALTAKKNVVNENVTGACQMTLMAIEENRYMDDMQLACDSLSDLATIASEFRQLFASRRFKGGESSSQFRWFTRAKIEL